MKTEVPNFTPQTGYKKLNVSSPFDAQRPIEKANLEDYGRESAEKIPTEFYSLKGMLASEFFFYDVTDLHIRPFNAEEVILLNYGFNAGSLRPMAAAIDQAIYEDFSCLDLTFSDVKQILCWLRINSFFKHKYTIKTICTNEEHQRKCNEEDLDVATLINEFRISNTDFVIDYIDTKKANDAFETLLNDYDLKFIPFTFRMYIEYDEYLKELNVAHKEDENGYREIDVDNNSPEVLNNIFIGHYAKYLAHEYGVTLKEKIEFFRALKLPPDIFQDILEFDYAVTHEVKEQVTNTCKECGGVIVSNLSITPRSFFP